MVGALEPALQHRGFCAQALKICVDTLVQRHVADEYRGRVFALYDMLFNVALVLAAVLTALVLPADGHAPVSVVVIGLIYLGTATVDQRSFAQDAAQWATLAGSLEPGGELDLWSCNVASGPAGQLSASAIAATLAR